MESPVTPDDESNQPEPAPASDSPSTSHAPGQQQNRRRRRRGPRRPRPRREGGGAPPASSQAQNSDTLVGDTLSRVRAIAQSLEELLAEMEEVLELLERAEAEKTADEQTIISLRQELDKIQRGAGFPRRPHREPAHAPPPSEPPPPPED